MVLKETLLCLLPVKSCAIDQCFFNSQSTELLQREEEYQKKIALFNQFLLIYLLLNNPYKKSRTPAGYNVRAFPHLPSRPSRLRRAREEEEEEEDVTTRSGVTAKIYSAH